MRASTLCACHPGAPIFFFFNFGEVVKLTSEPLYDVTISRSLDVNEPLKLPCRHSSLRSKLIEITEMAPPYGGIAP